MMRDKKKKRRKKRRKTRKMKKKSLKLTLQKLNSTVPKKKEKEGMIQRVLR